MKLDLKAIGKIKKIISKAPLEIFEKTPPLYILAPVALFFLIWGAILFYEYEIKSPEILPKPAKRFSINSFSIM